MSKKYFIDAFSKITDDYESNSDWKNIDIEQVHLILDNYDFEDDKIYYLSEQGGEEDVASWTSEDYRLVILYLAYLKTKEEFEAENS